MEQSLNAQRKKQTMMIDFTCTNIITLNNHVIKESSIFTTFSFAVFLKYTQTCFIGQPRSRKKKDSWDW